jgi:hypothetical protein
LIGLPVTWRTDSAGAAARVAVELGQNHAGQRQRVGERLGDIDGVLALHRIDHEQRLDRLQLRVQLADLAHHLLIDCEPARRVDDQHVVIVFARIIERARRDGDRFLRDVRCEEIRAGLRRQHFSCSIAAGR